MCIPSELADKSVTPRRWTERVSRSALSRFRGPETDQSLFHGLTHTTTNRTAGKAGGELGHPAPPTTDEYRAARAE